MNENRCTFLVAGKRHRRCVLSANHAGPHKAAERLPYEPPAVVSEHVFETLALSCARADPLVCPGGNPDRS